MSESRKFVEVTIAGHVLKVGPLLEREHRRACLNICNRWEAAIGKPINDAWLKDVRDGLSFVFLCAKPFHPDLTLSGLEEDLENGGLGVANEISNALDAIGVLTMEHFSIGVN